MSDTKEMSTVDVLMVATGIALHDEGGIAGVYRVLDWMTSESLMTHQLPRVAEEAAPILIAQYSMLGEARDEAKAGVSGKWREFRDKWIDAIGPTMAVPKLTADQHEYREPISEAAEMFPPEKMMVVQIKGGRS